MRKILTLFIALMSSQLFIVKQAYSETLLILGDSLSAGYNMPIEQSWPSLLPLQLEKLGKITKVVNGSISGDTTGNGLDRLPTLLKQHQPSYVLIELGANDGLRGFPPQRINANLESMFTQINAANAKPLLMQIQVPPNYGKRYSQAFGSLYPALSEKHDIPLLPFFLEEVIIKPEWMMKDGLHPKPEAQPWIATFMAKELLPYLK
ncbi:MULTISPECIES: multifunctional acyl-CoA thioesterase I/protease I/lysophospholipase L1 [Aliivibrio]|uniref:Multifunctional acyl-CoA thioesterase I/protease I/lysophospholipase L1 n=1 Tax=Aliivibrio finisterrensis TaxID=511998 RepID=A0A4Q5KMN6_9GAMM|nr:MULTISPECIES: multifunctional acyl-CoA thioesterase I/protease I/lysophospholipase L1 [Aliivibrio]MDD9179315.1 multifunctional acyl-CoA thioesterase I/protease I/lysophospholipase L1 [Aliivibrio sp. A6]RYU47731.1 multifunctional acyl-CoA thioesterase I/protease I/lysophospholipase L1 [Aliivibrio finisterrensis]RYU51415.1 multifunctional acyl-CoA thioesterase I/protease I/lysophospholipase L1 [Aliivibrio finisterrensis]RYU52595.1 multifunctional acyl-CoA thioesterase I/protease I/lysophosphol